MKNIRKKYHHGDLRSALLRGAVDIIAGEGVENLSLRSLAKGCGVSQTAPYRHFEDKNALLAALAEEGFIELTAAMTNARGMAKDEADALKQIGKAYIQWGMKYPEKYRLMFSSGIANRCSYEPLNRAGEAAYKALLDVFENAIARGVFRDQDPSMLSNTAWAMVHGLATLSVDRFSDQCGGDWMQGQIDFALDQLVKGFLA